MHEKRHHQQEMLALVALAVEQPQGSAQLTKNLQDLVRGFERGRPAVNITGDHK